MPKCFFFGGQMLETCEWEAGKNLIGSVAAH